MAGTAVDEAGVPQSAIIWATAVRSMGQGGDLLVSGKARSQVTGVDGAFEIQLPSGDPCRILARARVGSDGARAEASVTLDPGGDVRDLQLILAR